jgi:gluconate 2-dehydrogenase gamma chain
MSGETIDESSPAAERTRDAHGARLTEPQRSILDALTSRLIPSDELGPGAREASVPLYIERALAGDYREHFSAYADGLAELDRLSRSSRGSAFVDLTAEQQDAVLADVEAGAAEGVSPSLRDFFELALKHTREGMFCDPAWGGNQGYVGWELVGYPGPKHVWTREEQELDVVLAPTYSSSLRQAPGRESTGEVKP